MGAAAMLAWTICVLAVARLDGVEAQTEAAMTCSTAAATASTYSAATYAAAVIDYSDCTTNVVRVVTSSDGTTSLDLSSKQIVYVQSLPSVMSLNLKSNSISNLENVSVPSTVQTLDLSKNAFVSMQNFGFPSDLTKLTASNGKLASLHNVIFPGGVVSLNFSVNPITSVGGVIFPRSLKVLSITSSVKFQEFEVRQADATLFASLETFNVSMTTSRVCSDSRALYRYVQDTLLCVLADDVFNAKYGIKDDSGASSAVDVATTTTAPELQEAESPRRSKFLLFAAISLSLACAGLMSTLAPRTLYERYQKKKYLALRNKKQQKQAQQLPAVVKPTVLQVDAPELQRDPNVMYWDL